MSARCLCILLILVSSCFASADPPSPTLQRIDTRWADQLDWTNVGTGPGDVPLAGGESISNFTGNLHVFHSSSPPFRSNGNAAFALGRAYNSNSVFELAYWNSGATYVDTSGDSWSGLGWTSHLGRLIEVSHAKPVDIDGDSTIDQWNYWEGPIRSGYSDIYYEAPSGVRFRLDPYEHDPYPDMTLEYFEDCEDPRPWFPPPHCITIDPPPTCDPPEDTCTERSADPAEHYVLWFPDGTNVRFKRLGPNKQRLPSGWIPQPFRSIWYAERITDVDGNVVVIEYKESGPYPEAITSIRFDGKATPAITTTLYTEADHTAGDCPQSAVGAVKTVNSTGFDGQAVTYTYHYGSTTVVDESETSGVREVPLLKRVDLPFVGGQPTGSIEYGYEFEGVTGDWHVLTSIEYPSGFASEFTYGWHVSGRRVTPDSGLELQRTVLGVNRYRLWSDGRPAPGEHKPFADWVWSRLFDLTTCDGTDTPEGLWNESGNLFSLVAPDGRTATSSYSGHPCGISDMAWGPFGRQKRLEFRDAHDAVVREIQTEYDAIYDDATDEIIRVAGKKSTTTYHDDTGMCFGSGTPGEPRATTVSFFSRAPHGPWRQRVIESDYFPLRSDGSAGYVIDYTEYTVFTCQSENHVLNVHYDAFDQDHNRARRERRHLFDCEGHLTDQWISKSWDWSNDPRDGSLVTYNEPIEAGDSRVQLSYSSDGAVEQVMYTLEGATAHPSAFKLQTTYEAGILESAQWEGQGYKVADRTIDIAGYVAQTRDPNDQPDTYTGYNYDEFGRLTRVQRFGVASSPLLQLKYPDLRTTRAILSESESVQDDYVAGDSSQIFVERVTDGLGNPVTLIRAMPGARRSIQILRYDAVGRVIFESTWMDEAEYQSASKLNWDADWDGDGTSDGYFVTGVPLDPSGNKPWGTVYFYGVPSGDGRNPLKIVADPLSRLVVAKLAAGNEAQIEYCGPHERLTLTDVALDIESPRGSMSRTRYYDALGRLVLMESPVGSADASYYYGNAIGEIWLDEYDATGGALYDEWKHGALKTGLEFDGYSDPAGNVAWAPRPIGVEGCEYSNWNGLGLPRFVRCDADKAITQLVDYDHAGRVVRRSALSSHLPELADKGDFEGADALAYWERGWIDSQSRFVPESNPDESPWTVRAYAELASCGISAAPDGGSYALVLGTGCDYGQASILGNREYAARVKLDYFDSRSDEVELVYRRNVRESGSNLDRFRVLIARTSTDDSDLSDSWVLHEQDANQRSHSKWTHVGVSHLSELLPTGWVGDTGFEYWLVISFEKGDEESNNLGQGIAVDNVRSVPSYTLAEYSYDEDHCANGNIACSEPGSNAPLGQLTTATSYIAGNPSARYRYSYDAYEGQIGTQSVEVDWTLAAGIETAPKWLIDYKWTRMGQLAGRTSPYQPGATDVRTYESFYDRGLLSSISERHEQGYSGPRLGALLEVDAGGGVTKVEYLTGARSAFARDLLGRTSAIETMASDGSVAWSSGAIEYDGRGSVTTIGDQLFGYTASGELAEARILAGAQGETQSDLRALRYQYDHLGNMVSRTEALGQPAFLPVELRFENRQFGDYAIQEQPYSYDRSGSLRRFPGAQGATFGATFDLMGKLDRFLDQNLVPAEQYQYDAFGLRTVRIPLRRSNLPLVTIRDIFGMPVAEYEIRPEQTDPELVREFVNADGRVLVERLAVDTAPLVSGSSVLGASGVYGVEISGSVPGEVYEALVSNLAGATIAVPNLAPDANSVVYVAESDLFATETNFVRIRRVQPSQTDYSAPVTIAFDPGVIAGGDNLVRALGVAREGNDISIRWETVTGESRSKRVYFRNVETGTTALLTPVPLAAGIRNHIVPNQALANQCGEVFLTEQKSDGTESSPSQRARLGSSGSGGSISPDDCVGGSPPPDPEDDRFVDMYLHWDHLGNTRIVTGEAGEVTGRIDYYPFGYELISDSGSLYSEIDRKFGGHDRDEETGLDYMWARFKLTTEPTFMTSDPATPASASSTGALNRFSFVENSPLTFTDPLGLQKCPVVCIPQADGSQYCCECCNCAEPGGTVVEADSGSAGQSRDYSHVGVGRLALANLGLLSMPSPTESGTAAGGELRGLEAMSVGLNLGAASGTILASIYNLPGLIRQALNLGGRGAARGVLATPKVASTKLQNIINDLYKGTTNPGRVGTGTTADAVRHELATGQAVGGRFHSQKAADYARGLENWLRGNPNAPYQDRLVAQSVLDDLRSALGGGP